MLTKKDLLDIVLLAVAREGQVPDRTSVEQRIDGMLAGFPHLAASREWLLSQTLEVLVTAVDEAEVMIAPDDYQPWLSDEDRSQWASWPWQKLYLRNKLHRPVSVLDELDRSTDRVLDLLGDPKREGIWDRRGLVVGHVQSGKTQHYTALVAKAIDAGFKVVIILSGIHENLRQQTQERIEECISGKNSRDGFGHFGIRTYQETYFLDDRPEKTLPDITTTTSVAGDFGAAVNRVVDVALGSVPVVMVVKKNASILRNLLKKLRGADSSLSFQKNPVLVIDDEADHSSVNAAKEDEDPKRINEQIRKILWCCDKVAFVGYTATPYANIFMDDVLREKTESRKIDDYGSDLFPRSFIISLKAPSNYIGPDVVFGHDGDESVGIAAVSPLPMQIPVDDADAWLPPRHKNGHTVTAGLPESLKTALRCFVLSVSARSALGQDTSHCSMLVHVTRFNSVQSQVKNQIQAHLEAFRERLQSSTDRQALYNEMRALWNTEFADKFEIFRTHPSQINDPPILSTWAEVESFIIPSLERMKYSLVNSLTKEDLDFSGNADSGLIVVAVGGDRLSRGLTLEGLSCSYFLRGARAFDTLMQMARWFGYRPGYAHLCRIFAPRSIITNFKTISLATEELRREFGRMCYLNKRPSDYGLQIREPRGDLMVTALNRMRRGETVRIHFAESLITSLEFSETDLEPNLQAFRELIDSLKVNGPAQKTDAVGDKKDGGQCRVWQNVKWDFLIPFFAAYNANLNVCLDRATATGRSLLHNYIESVVARGELSEWTVVIVGSNTGSRSVPGMDEGFHPVGRKRLVTEPEGTEPLHPGFVSFNGVAVGQDEGMDLSREQRKEAEAAVTNNATLSRAGVYRSMRPSTRGLLLIYPIIPTTPKAAQALGQKDTGYLWAEKHPLIGIGVSLPSSNHDNGCDYVCTRQKLREIFGELADDFERDEKEDSELS